MTKLVITRGLPGSGKTTYAKTWVSESAETRSRLNRDDLREMLHGGPHDYQRELEHKVTVAHQAAVLDLLKRPATSERRFKRELVRGQEERARRQPRLSEVRPEAPGAAAPGGRTPGQAEEG